MLQYGSNTFIVHWNPFTNEYVKYSFSPCTVRDMGRMRAGTISQSDSIGDVTSPDAQLERHMGVKIPLVNTGDVARKEGRCGVHSCPRCHEYVYPHSMDSETS